MRFAKVLLAAAALVAMLAPGARADEWNKKTILTFSGPVQLPGVTLPAGSYVFKLADLQGNRHVVQVFDKDEKKIYATLLAIPNDRLEPADKPIVLFSERASGSPQAVKVWFYPGDRIGDEFVYPKTQAMRIAKETHQSVLAMNDDSKMANTAGEIPVEAKSAALGRFDENGTWKSDSDKTVATSNAPAATTARAQYDHRSGPAVDDLGFVARDDDVRRLQCSDADANRRNHRQPPGASAPAAHREQPCTDGTAQRSFNRWWVRRAARARLYFVVMSGERRTRDGAAPTVTDSRPPFVVRRLFAVRVSRLHFLCWCWLPSVPPASPLGRVRPGTELPDRIERARRPAGRRYRQAGTLRLGPPRRSFRRLRQRPPRADRDLLERRYAGHCRSRRRRQRQHASENWRSHRCVSRASRGRAIRKTSCSRSASTTTSST